MRMKRLGRNVATLVAVLLLVLMAGCVPMPGGVTPSPAPEEGAPATTPEEVAPPPAAEPIPAPMPEANFRLLISDDVNAIGDFESLVVTIDSVGVHKVGGDGEWIEPPAVEELDLVPLQGDNAEEIWSGTLPDGDYNKVFVYVSEIDAELNTGDSTEVKLPSEKLYINTHFSIPTPDDSPVSFVFDISVVAAGNQQSGIKYILKPVVSQSGPNQKFIEVSTQEREEEQEREREGEEEEELEVEGSVVRFTDTELVLSVAGEEVVITLDASTKIKGDLQDGSWVEVEAVVAGGLLLATEIEVEEAEEEEEIEEEEEEEEE